MKYEKLPSNITFLRRTAWESRILALLACAALYFLFLHFSLKFNFRLKNENPTIFNIFLFVYIVFSAPQQENIGNWIYRRIAKMQKEEFIKVHRGIVSFFVPPSKPIAVWVTLIAKCMPVFLVSILPGIFFSLLGINELVFCSILILFVYLFFWDVMSLIFYLPFYSQTMIEYPKQKYFFGIDYFDIYFFPKSHTDSAKSYINQLRQT